MSDARTLIWGRKISLSIASATAVLVVMEVLLWMTGSPTWARLMRQDSTFSAEDQEVYEALRQLVQRPGRGQKIPGTSAWRYTPVESAHLNINERGFRGELPAAKGADELRVVMLGGSTVFGWLVADHRTLPALLQDEMTRREPWRPVRVINLGIEGHRLQQELEWAEHILGDLDPDLLLFVDGANDALVAHMKGWSMYPSWEDGGRMPPLVVAYERKGVAWRFRNVLKHSRTISASLLAGYRLAVEGDPVDLHRPLTAELEERSRALARGWKGLLERVLRLEQDLDCRSIVFLQPALSTKQPLSREEKARLLRAEAASPLLGPFYATSVKRLAAAGPPELEVVDLSDAFDGVEATRFQDWVHPTPEGLEELAARVADYLTAPVTGSPAVPAQRNES